MFSTKRNFLFFEEEEKIWVPPEKRKIHLCDWTSILSAEYFQRTQTKNTCNQFCEFRNLSRIFLNTSWLCFTIPYVFPKVVKYHFQLKITGLFGTLLVLSNYSTHDCKLQQNCKQIFLYSRLLYCLLRTKVYTCLEYIML